MTSAKHNRAQGKPGAESTIGRPRVEPHLERDIPALIAPLLMANRLWSSSDIGAQRGISQSSMSRLWQHYYPVRRVLDLHATRLVGVAIDRDASYLVLTPAPIETAFVDISEHFMRSPRRRALQCVLAADLIRPQLENDKVDLESFFAVLPQQPLVIVTTGSPQKITTAEQHTTFHISDAEHWQALLHDLVLATGHTPAESLNDVQRELMNWARQPISNFVWQEHVLERSTQTVSHGKPTPLNQVIANQGYDFLLESLKRGKLHAGSRVTESLIARELHTTRNQAREAIKTLISNGLLDYENNRGALIPTPTVADVVDIYAARKALGSIVMRKVSRLTLDELKPARAALDHMKSVARGKDPHDVGAADLEFQYALAKVTHMRNVPDMFNNMTDQLNLFIESMGLSYSYSIEDMCRDNENIYQHIAAHEVEAAIDAWHRKMDDALRYITKQLNVWQRNNR